MASKTSPFDVYFHQTSKSTRSSDTLFSQTSLPLSRTQLDALLASSAANQKHVAERARLQDDARALFGYWLDELFEGFNLLFYGYGSKRNLVNEFATTKCAEHGHIVVVNGYIPTVGTSDILSSIEQIPDLVDSQKLDASTAENRAKRVFSFFAQDNVDPLFLVIHNMDAPQLRTPRAQRVLVNLASAKHIHLIATVDHVNSALLFSRDQALARKPHLSPFRVEPGGQRAFRGWSWLWHDLTTFEPYTAELAHRDLTVPPSTSAAAAAAASASTTIAEVTPSAAQHVFASVTAKAQKLYRILASRQLSALQDEGVARVLASGMDKYAVAFDVLLGAARDEFVAANEAALRGLLGEFRDHGMVVSREREKSQEEGGGVEEILWVPAAQDVLETILGYLNV
ncbi:DNA replication origin binding protein [Ceratobasidium sp. AG-Ba]|nr:DNA replication origin binding protein [Ceratobasidium sp. AG-Ba]QRW06250.1 DNA replication origin binding protein [Ceratobasidium sp. AG-Ba]